MRKTPQGSPLKFTPIYDILNELIGGKNLIINHAIYAYNTDDSIKKATRKNCEWLFVHTTPSDKWFNACSVTKRETNGYP